MIDIVYVKFEDNNKKRVAWPPVETNISNNGDEICQSIEAPFLQQKLPARHQLAAVSASKAAPPVPPKPANPIINPKDFDVYCYDILRQYYKLTHL